MLVQPQQAATVCELDPVQHTIGSSKRAQTLDPNQPPENSHEPLKLTLDLEYAHVSGHRPDGVPRHTRPVAESRHIGGLMPSFSTYMKFAVTLPSSPFGPARNTAAPGF